MNLPNKSHPTPMIPSSKEEYMEKKLPFVDDALPVYLTDEGAPSVMYHPLMKYISKDAYKIEIEVRTKPHIPEPPLDKSRIELAIKKAVHEWFPNVSDRLLEAIVKDFKGEMDWT